MNYDKMNACADMILTVAIEDLAEERQISFASARNIIIESGAYDVLYDFDSGLWMEGSDYFLDFVRKMESRPANKKSREENYYA